MIEITSYYILYFYFKNLLPEGNFVRTFCLSWNLPCLKVSRTSRFTLVRSRLDSLTYSSQSSSLRQKIVVVAFEDISRRCLLQLLNSVGDIIIRMEQILEIDKKFPLQQFHVEEDEYLLPSRPIVFVTADLLDKNNSNCISLLELVALLHLYRS